MSSPSLKVMFSNSIIKRWAFAALTRSDPTHMLLTGSHASFIVFFCTSNDHISGGTP
jgi:hypothetical protein